MRTDRAYLIAVLCAAAPLAAAAAPLDPDACSTLKTEHQRLVTAGAKSDMDKGPEWAKTNLAPDRLGAIERLIEVQEQLSFRCGDVLTARPALKELPKPPVADAQGADATKTGQNEVKEGQRLSNIPLPKRKGPRP